MLKSFVMVIMMITRSQSKARFIHFIPHNFISELATWLVGSSIVVDSDDLATSSNDESATAILHTDSLLNIVIENAQDNLDILLPTLQFIEVC